MKEETHDIRARKEYEAIRGFYVHVMVFVPVMLLLVVLDGLGGSGMWVHWAGLGWGLGLAFHAYALPGGPASHACVRLLERDARWLFGWGEGWALDERGWNVIDAGTPVWIVGQYNFGAPPPWRSLQWLSTGIQLPAPTCALQPDLVTLSK